MRIMDGFVEKNANSRPWKDFRALSFNRSRLAMISSCLLLSMQALPAPATEHYRVDSRSSTERPEALMKLDREVPGWNVRESHCDPVRFEQAKSLLERGAHFIEKAKSLRAKIQEDLLLAQNLEGQIKKQRLQLPEPPKLNLSGKALEDATRQYEADLKRFANMISDYNANLERFRHTIGECRIAQDEYDQQRRDYTIHVDQFHVPVLASIPPPIICPPVEEMQVDTEEISSAVRQDAARLQEAVEALENERDRLDFNNDVAGLATDVAIRSARRREEEDRLQADFNKLRTMYKLLDVQRKALDPSQQKKVGAIVTKQVQGKIKTDGKN